LHPDDNYQFTWFVTLTEPYWEEASRRSSIWEGLSGYSVVGASKASLLFPDNLGVF
jgi:hypothetical protein